MVGEIKRCLETFVSRGREVCAEREEADRLVRVLERCAAEAEERILSLVDATRRELERLKERKVA